MEQQQIPVTDVRVGDKVRYRFQGENVSLTVTRVETVGEYVLLDDERQSVGINAHETEFVTVVTERLALVEGITTSGQDPVTQYLPANYELTDILISEESGRFAATIVGVDVAGWTLEDYVIPRLASGGYSCAEVIR